MKLINPGAAERYEQWQSEPLTDDDWQNNVLCEQSGVKLIEIGVDVYVVDYNDAGRRARSPLCYSWNEAEANFVRRVEEEDYC